MKTELGVLHCTLSIFLCVALGGCRGSDVVMYDARSRGVIWGSVGTDSDWRECLSLAVDGKNSRFYTLQTVNRDAKAKKAKLKLRAYDFTGVAHDEFVFDSDITYIGQDSFVVSGGGLYRWEYIQREDVFNGKSPADPSERIICRVTNLDHMELRRYDPVTGTFVRIELPGDWCGETTSHHFDYCNGGVIVLARHGPIDIAYYSGDVPIRSQKGDGNGIFRVGHDGSVTEVFRENDMRAERLKLVCGWSRAWFAARTGKGDVRIFDKDCHEVQHVQLSQSHAEFVKDPFFCVYEWIDDTTIACYRRLDKGNDAVVLIIDARTGKVREAVRSEFNLVGKYRVRLKDSLILKERF